MHVRAASCRVQYTGSAIAAAPKPWKAPENDENLSDDSDDLEGMDGFALSEVSPPPPHPPPPHPHPPPPPPHPYPSSAFALPSPLAPRTCPLRAALRCLPLLRCMHTAQGPWRDFAPEGGFAPPIRTASSLLLLRGCVLRRGLTLLPCPGRAHRAFCRTRSTSSRGCGTRRTRTTWRSRRPRPSRPPWTWRWASRSLIQRSGSGNPTAR